MDSYTLIDSGDEEKLERFGDITLIRPAAQAVWKKQNPRLWNNANASFSRKGESGWRGKIPESWYITVAGIQFLIKPTDFGHLGIFPEQKPFWEWMRTTIQQAKRPISVLNLFAYSGGATIACAQGGAKVCHLDASKGMVDWARENAKKNNLEKAPIRWIIDDAIKFLQREIRRESFYDAIILDPPTFGRGAKGELFKIEAHIGELLSLCGQLLSKKPLFLLFSCHTPGFTAITMKQLLQQNIQQSDLLDTGEMILPSQEGFELPSGTFIRWTPHVL